MNASQDDPDLAIIDSIYEALDGGQPEQALELARRELDSADAADPVLNFLAAAALFELDRPAQAAVELRHAVELDPDDAEFRAALALALFLSCDFQAAEAESAQALAADDGSPDALHVHALLLERKGLEDEAEEHFTRAAEIDPDGFPAPRRLSREEFEGEIERAAQLLDESFRKHLDEAVVTVESLPSEEILREETPPLDPELLGLFVGVSLAEQSQFSPGGELPPRILLFQRNLERAFPEPQELRTQIARTLHHELGHYLGFDEDGLEAIGLK